MCSDCGCGDPDVVPVEVQEKILSDNDHRAAHNRHHFETADVVTLNLMGSPGCGKTRLLEATAGHLSMPGLAGRKHRRRLAAMSGDLATDNDAKRLQEAGIPSTAVTTGQACHLDARLVHQALHRMEGWQDADFLFVENVGNLVCPAIYDLGQAANVVVLSVTEGDDKPLKYPVMFHHADLVVVTKIDLLPHLPDASLDRIRENLARVMPDPQVLALSALTGDGMGDWIAWLESLRPSVAQHRPSSPTSTGATRESATRESVRVA